MTCSLLAIRSIRYLGPIQLFIATINSPCWLIHFLYTIFGVIITIRVELKLMNLILASVEYNSVTTFDIDILVVVAHLALALIA